MLTFKSFLSFCFVSLLTASAFSAPVLAEKEKAISFERVQGIYMFMSGNVQCASALQVQYKDSENKKILEIQELAGSKQVRSFDLTPEKSIKKSATGLCRQFQRQVVGLSMGQYSRSSDDCNTLEYNHWQSEKAVAFRRGEMKLEYQKNPDSRQVVSCQYRLN